MATNDWKQKFSTSDMRLCSKLESILKDIENHTVDQAGKNKIKSYRMQLHEIRVKMVSVNQDMHFAF